MQEQPEIKIRKISQKDILEHGPTEGCWGCRAIVQGHSRHAAHSAECRVRIQDLLMQNDEGKKRNFIVTKLDDKTLTVDGNNPLCGRHVVFTLEVLNVRDATDEEIEAGGPEIAESSVDDALKVPI